MNTATRQQLWQRLVENRLAEGELPPVDSTGAAPPWYVRVMLGIAGWIGALFLFGFVGAAFSMVLKSAGASLVAGLLCCAGAWAVFRVARGNDFASQFGLAASLAGQALFIAGLLQMTGVDKPVAFYLAFAFEVLLAVLVPNFIHRVLAAWAAMVALSFALDASGVHGLASGIAAAAFALVWLNESRWAAGSVWAPIGYGIGLALLQIDSSVLWPVAAGFHGASPASSSWFAAHAPAIASVLVLAVLLWSVTRLLAAEGVRATDRAGIAALAAAALVSLASFAAHGLDTALLILLLGFAAGNRVLAGLGLFALLAFLSHYYWRMDATLLVKSMMLASTGLLLLAGRMLMRKLLPAPAGKSQGKETGHV